MTKVIIALPGRTFSGSFLMNWTQTIMTLAKSGYQVTVSNEFSSFVPFSRMKTLGLDVLRGSEQKPFGGTLEYDVWLTIDSDIVFTPEQVIELIEDTKKYPVVSGLYRMQDMKHYACVKEWDTDYFKQTGTFQFMKVGELDVEEKYIPVSYNGMGFFACRKGVIETMRYPYFSYPLIEIEGEDGKVLRDMCSEDVAFCKNLSDAGFDIMVNTGLLVGHEKTLVL
jgi:hypothetical protein|tara:strand:+ start:1281 stop:1952 length:672 start_codon:yes stop_codon:yes gene_type:complete